ncbi:hypothetical protein PybrP1_006161 [[Pythium] brassicae (nom. inval.)]|nr:hypothetical protein PybrP1_006161 [[Pythium] brassicae (nom. inval.)]
MRGVFSGDLVDGIRHGAGVLVFANGDRYEGAFAHGFRDGHGVFTSERGNRVFEGQWRRSEKHGVGRERWLASGDRYDGEYERDVFHGRGVLTRGVSGSTYDGEFQDGKKHGRGRMEFAVKPRAGGGSGKADLKSVLAMGISSSAGGGAGSVSVYDGSWKDGRMHGEGKYTRADGGFYEGTWLDGLCHGVGKEMVLATGELYDGQWLKGQRHGEGAVTRNGKRRRGVWDMGQRVKWTTAEVSVFKKA